MKNVQYVIVKWSWRMIEYLFILLTSIILIILILYYFLLKKEFINLSRIVECYRIDESDLKFCIDNKVSFDKLSEYKKSKLLNQGE